jgi:YD repeat-containing protein
MGNSHRHAHVKVPIILLGGLDGTFQGNRHIVFPDNTERTSNMLLALLHKYGIDETPTYDAAGRRKGTTSSFGSSTKPIPL